MVIADDIDQTTAPYEYAAAVLKMFGDFLLNNYKKFDKTNLNDLLLKMDRQYIESFEFPARFEEQRYSFDDSEYPVMPLINDNNDDSNTEWIM